VDDIAADIGPLVEPGRRVEQMTLFIHEDELGDILTSKRPCILIKDSDRSSP